MVHVYTKENCIQCDATIRFLEKRKVPHIKYSIEHNSAWRQHLPNAVSAPIVHNTETGASWSGFRKEELDKCVS